jgi:hypothetical protein
VHNAGSWENVAGDDDNINDDKYSTSKNPPTGLYYRLHILNVGVSDVKKYKCETSINGDVESFYVQLTFIHVGRCNYILVIFNVVKQGCYACR